MSFFLFMEYFGILFKIWEDNDMMSHYKSLEKLINFSGIQKSYFRKMESMPFLFFFFFFLMFWWCRNSFPKVLFKGLEYMWGLNIGRTKSHSCSNILYRALELTLMLRILKSMFFPLRDKRTIYQKELIICLGSLLLEAKLVPRQAPAGAIGFFISTLQRALLKIFDLSFKNVMWNLEASQLFYDFYPS